MQKLLSLLAILSLIVGCGTQPALKENCAELSGTVTYKGSPLPAGMVSVVSKQNESLGGDAVIKPDGSFSIQYAPLGEAYVTVDTSIVRHSNPPQYVEIPKRYADPAKSGLTVQIKAGAEPVELKLE
jgi:hypothetical protein